MAPTSKLRDGLLAAAITLLSTAIIAAVWCTGLSHRMPSKAEEAAFGSVLSGSSEEADPELTSAESARMSVGAGSESEPEPEAEGYLVLAPPPDAPAEPTTELRQQFEAQLLRAAELNGTGTVQEACLEWGRLLILALDDEASDAERMLAFLNVADACARAGETPRSPHELRLAHEALVRRVEDDPESRAELDGFLAKHSEFTNMRAALLVINQHPRGTIVSLDGEQTCTEPCTLAVPIDGKSHRIAFVGPGGSEASVDWNPSAPDAAPPQLPELQR